MQIYADILNRPMAIAGSLETVAIGFAIMGATAALKGETEFEGIQQIACKVKEKEYKPNMLEVKTYDKLYKLYSELHDAFGIKNSNSSLYKVMKELLSIKKMNL